jgi:hypothetical protein
VFGVVRALLDVVTVLFSISDSAYVMPAAIDLARLLGLFWLRLAEWGADARVGLALMSCWHGPRACK